MLIQKKYFNVDAFLQQINAPALTGLQLTQIIEEEISRVENLKIILVENIQQHPEPTVRITNDIDSYIYSLQALLVDLGADRFTNEVLSTDRMKQIRGKILAMLENDSL